MGPPCVSSDEEYADVSHFHSSLVKEMREEVGSTDLFSTPTDLPEEELFPCLIVDELDSFDTRLRLKLRFVSGGVILTMDAKRITEV